VRLHINRHVIAANHKTGERAPPIAVIRGGSVREYDRSVDLIGGARIISSPDKPLSCGARLWIEADNAITT
jgi:hypothetical protein